MPIFKKGADDRFVPFESTPFPDLEKTLEDWIEKNPHLLLEGEELAIIGRQPRTKFDKYLDLLAVDETGACVVVELKKGVTPRDVIAQALEYAAWVDSLSPEQLNDLAHDYAESRKLEAVGVEDLYRMTFDPGTEDGAEEEGRESGAARVTFNSRQRIVIVAERISDEVEQTLRYLRTRLGTDVYGITFSVHRLGGDEIISTTTVVGRELVQGGGASSTATLGPTLEELFVKVAETRPLFANLQQGLKDIGLLPRPARSSISFDRVRGESLINMWPSPGGYVIVLFYGSKASQLGNLSHFQTSVEGIGLEVRRGKSDLTVHVQPSEIEKIPDLVAIVKDHFLAAPEGDRVARV